MGTKGGNDDDIKGILGRAQSSPKKLLTKFSIIIFIFQSESGQWQSFCNSPTTKANVKNDMNSTAYSRRESWPFDFIRYFVRVAQFPLHPRKVESSIRHPITVSLRVQL